MENCVRWHFISITVDIAVSKRSWAELALALRASETVDNGPSFLLFGFVLEPVKQRPVFVGKEGKYGSILGLSLNSLVVVSLRGMHLTVCVLIEISCQ